MPAYNEEQRLAPNLERIHGYFCKQDYDFNVTVVSDGSKDRTTEVVNNFIASHPEFSLIAYQPNKGKGYAVRKGMLAAKGDVVLFMDADLATPLEETEKLLEHMHKGADIAIGSRPLKESNLEKHQPMWREALGRGANTLVRMMAVRGIHDTQCGFKAFTNKAAQDVFSRCKLNGFSFDFEALMVARDLGYRIDEVAIRWSHQEGSKVVFWRDYPRALRDLILLRLKGKKARLAASEP